MASVIGIAGSLRKASLNAALLRAAAQVAPSSLSVDIASIAGIPLYDGDLESEHGAAEAVESLKERIAASDGLLLVTPEYNNSIPGAFKNAIDWLSRPSADIARVFGGKPCALMGATPGRGGTLLAQAAWLPVLRVLGTRLWCAKQLNVGNAGSVFDETGQLVDNKVRQLLTDYMHGFSAFIGSENA